MSLSWQGASGHPTKSSSTNVSQTPVLGSFGNEQQKRPSKIANGRCIGHEPSNTGKITLTCCKPVSSSFITKASNSSVDQHSDLPLRHIVHRIADHCQEQAAAWTDPEPMAGSISPAEVGTFHSCTDEKKANEIQNKGSQHLANLKSHSA